MIGEESGERIEWEFVKFWPIEAYEYLLGSLNEDKLT
jgi:hypothetical protein